MRGEDYPVEEDMNEEFLVSMCQQHVLNASLPFVHTARRYYRWVVKLECWIARHSELGCLEEVQVVTRFP